MKQISFYVRPDGDDYKVYSPEYLKSKEVKEGDDTYKLDSDQNIQRWFGFKEMPVQKCTILLNPYLDRNNTAVEASLVAFDEKTREWKRDGTRWEARVIEEAVSTWDLTKLNSEFVNTEAGVGQMPLGLAASVKLLVTSEIFGGQSDEAFLA